MLHVERFLIEVMTGFQAKLLLLCVFAARGTSFLFSKVLLRSMSPENVLAERFLLSFAVLAVVFHKKMRSISRKDVQGGLVLGALYSLCMFFEMHGLRTVDTGVAAFVENMAIVFVPLYVAVFTGALPSKKTLFCCVLAVAGVGFLSLSQVSGRSGAGIILVILAAFTYGVCILATERVSREGDPLTIGILQLGFMGLAGLVAAPFTGTLRLPATALEWTMILLLALVCSCFGFAFQPVGQKYLPAETAAVFTVVNPLTASVLGLVAAGESFGPAKAAGYALILVSLLIYNWHSPAVPSGGSRRVAQDNP